MGLNPVPPPQDRGHPPELPPAALAPGGFAMPSAPPRRRGLLRRAEFWIPAVYAAASGAWIAFSDRLMMAAAWASREQLASWSLAKGLAFVLATALLLHAGIRHAIRRERRGWQAAASRDALLQTLAEAIPDPIFLKDTRSRFVYANAATLAVIGKPAREVLGRADSEVYADAALGEALMATDRRILASGRAEMVEERVLTPGGVRLFLSTKTPYHDAEGNLVGLLGSARDITDRKAAEEGLRASADRLRLFVAEAPAALAMLDREMRYLAVSQRWRDDYGLGDQPLVGRTHYEVFPDVPDRWREIHRRCLEGAVECCEEDPFLRADGRTEWLRWEVRPWRDPAGAVGGLVIFSELITRRREAEHRLAETAERLHQSQKLESVGRLAGGIAHDFNNLLTVIQGAASLLREDLSSGQPPRPEDVDEIQSAARRATDLTRQLLAFARKQVIAPVALDLAAAVRNTEKLLKRVLGEDIALRTELAEGTWTVRCDPGQLEQVILNLALNARAAMPRGGVLTLATRNLPGAAPAGDAVALAVHDTGVGMTPEVQAHLFEPFFTTKAPGEGTGLGLATVYGIVRQCGGHIAVESTPGQGSTFTLRFPRHRGAPDAQAAPPALARLRGSETVLVVEDDPQVRDVTVRILRSGGYEVLVARDGEQALEVFAHGAVKPRLVVSDVVMPGLDGRAVADELRRRFGPVPVLFVSGYTRDVLQHHGVLDSGIEFLAKPFTPPMLLERVRAALDGAAGA